MTKAGNKTPDRSADWQSHIAPCEAMFFFEAVFARATGASGTAFRAAVDQLGTYTSYIAGYTYSVDYPVTAGAYQALRKSLPDAFVTRLDGSGAMIWSTYLGGSSTDQERAAEHGSRQD